MTVWGLFFGLIFLGVVVYVAWVQIKRYWIKKFIEFSEERYDWTGKKIAEYLKYLHYD